MELKLNNGRWIYEPQSYLIEKDKITITTEPSTDFWQRSYYGFRNDNAPAYLFEEANNFTFSCKVSLDYQQQFDQCGLIIYQDCENWFKASIEYENEKFSRLGGVLTNLGYSDWATNDIELPKEIWYRLSRRGPDFRLEYSLNGKEFKQLRIFHLLSLGETTLEMGKENPPRKPEKSVSFGIYACSPLESSFKAEFSDFKIEKCCWAAHQSCCE